MQLLWLGICEIDLLFNFVEVEQPKPMGRELMTFLCLNSSRALAALEKWLLFVSACIIHSIGRQQHMGTLYHWNSGSSKLSGSAECLGSVCHLESLGHGSAGAARVSESSLGSRVPQSAVYTLGASSYITSSLLCVCAIVQELGFPSEIFQRQYWSDFFGGGEACLLKTLRSSDKKSLDFSALAKIWEGIQPSFPDRRFMNV